MGSWRSGFSAGGQPDVSCILCLLLFVGHVCPVAVVFFSRTVHDRPEDPPGIVCASRLATTGVDELGTDSHRILADELRAEFPCPRTRCGVELVAAPMMSSW